MVDPAAPRPRRLWRFVLVVSLALNLAVVGLIAGFAFRGGRDGPPRGIELAMGPIGQALAPADRRAIVGALRKSEDLRPRRNGPRFVGISEMVSALTSEPYDPAAFAQSLEVAETRQRDVRDAVRTALIDRVAQMSADERAAFAQRLEAAAQGGPKRQKTKR